MVMLYDQNTMNIQPQERKKKKHENWGCNPQHNNGFPLYNIV
jgi:hypothetical protein